MTPDHAITLDLDQVDVLTEVINIGVGRAAYSLSEMMQCRVGIEVPKVVAGRWPDASFDVAIDGAASIVSQGFSGAVEGTAALVFERGSARALVGLLTEAAEDSIEIDAEREAVLTEVGNIIINGVLGSLGNLTSLDVRFGLPRYCEGSLTPILGADSSRFTVIVGVVFSIAERAVEGRLGLMFDLPALSSVWALLDPTTASMPACAT
jgi:chemotaxis protein CheC